MKVLHPFLIVSLLSASMARAQNRSAEAVNFPFQNQAIQFRLNQGFFSAGASLFEEILKSSGLVDKNNVLKIDDKEAGVVHTLRYRKIGTAIQLYDRQIIGRLAVDIAESKFYVTSVGKNCSISLQGPLTLDVILMQNSRGAMDVSVPKNRFDDKKLKVTSAGCGFFGGLIRGMVPDKLQESIREAINKVANEEELRVVTPAEVDKAMKEANVFMNMPAKAKLDPRKNASKVDIDIGILGFLSNARGTERVFIGNPGAKYLNSMGFEWSLDAGLKANSKNIYNPNFRPESFSSSEPFPVWGLEPYRKLGKPLDFDAGLMIRTGFLKTLFETLYAAGFFNIQVQDSLLKKDDSVLDAVNWAKKLKVILPTGEPLDASNYADSRLEIRLAAPPELKVRKDREFELVVPDFYLTLMAKSKGSSKEFEVLKMRAKFNLLTSIGMDQNARLTFRFNDKPVHNFEVISRGGVDPSVPDSNLEAELNTSIVALLNKSDVEIPFLRGRKIEIKSLGIAGGKDVDKALALYLKIK